MSRVFFLGAGASVEAGVPMSRELKSAMRRGFDDFSHEHFLDWDEPDDFDVEQSYSAMLHAFVQANANRVRRIQSQIGDTLRLLKQAVLVAQLNSIRYLEPLAASPEDTIVTLNFDNVLELLAQSQLRAVIDMVSTTIVDTPLPTDVMKVWYLNGRLSDLVHGLKFEEVQKEFGLVKMLEQSDKLACRFANKNIFVDQAYLLSQAIAKAQTIYVIGYSFKKAALNDVIKGWHQSSNKHRLVLINSDLQDMARSVFVPNDKDESSRIGVFNQQLSMCLSEALND